MKRMSTYSLLGLAVALVVGAPVQAQPPAPVPSGTPYCEPLKKACIPVPGTKKVTKTIYDCRCDDYCLPNCSLWSCWSHKSCCNDCTQCADCEKPRVRRVLIKKFKTTEECINKCEVVHVPCNPCPPCPPCGVIIK